MSHAHSNSAASQRAENVKAYLKKNKVSFLSGSVEANLVTLTRNCRRRYVEEITNKRNSSEAIGCYSSFYPPWCGEYRNTQKTQNYSTQPLLPPEVDVTASSLIFGRTTPLVLHYVVLLSLLCCCRYPGILWSDLIGQSEMDRAFQGGRSHGARQPVGLLQPSKHDGDLRRSAQPQHQHRGKSTAKLGRDDESAIRLAGQMLQLFQNLNSLNLTKSIKSPKVEVHRHACWVQPRTITRSVTRAIPPAYYEQIIIMTT